MIEESEEKYAFSWDGEQEILSTPFYKIKLTDCGIAYIDTVDGRIVDNGDEKLFSACIDDELCFSDGKWTVSTDACSAFAVYEGKIGSVPFKFEMSLNGNNPRIDCRTEFEVRGEHIGKLGEKMGLKKSLTVEGHMHESKLCLNLNLCLDENRRMVRDLPYSISDWSGDIRVTEDYWYKEDLILIDKTVSPEESFRNSTQFNGIYWLAMRDGKKGLAVMNRGCMGAAVNGNRLSVPLVYANSYMCGTKMLDGIYDDEFSLMPFDASLSDSQLHKKLLHMHISLQLSALKRATVHSRHSLRQSLKQTAERLSSPPYIPKTANCLHVSAIIPIPMPLLISQVPSTPFAPKPTFSATKKPR